MDELLYQREMASQTYGSQKETYSSQGGKLMIYLFTIHQKVFLKLEKHYRASFPILQHNIELTAGFFNP